MTEMELVATALATGAASGLTGTSHGVVHDLHATLWKRQDSAGDLQGVLTPAPGVLQWRQRGGAKVEAGLMSLQRRDCQRIPAQDQDRVTDLRCLPQSTTTADGSARQAK
ncbi:hypothetical protein ACFU6S_21800 [Streptomyces sp. NPDC057456]|uniref:hypothetical protein n=1 Tax=Streptomyces sp. NPDC057456 TaxID=3346139 RepID=UPI0036A242C4